MQSELDFFEENKELSEQVRDINYEQVMQSEHIKIQREIVKNILLEYPEGITDIEICILTGISRSSVTARRNEIKGMVAVGVAKIVDELNGDRLNTLWSVI